MKIGRDHSRFKKIVRGKIKNNLKKFISNGSIIGKQGKDKVSIPVSQINLPRFKFNSQQAGGIGQGDGEVGDSLGQGEGSEPGQAGQGEGEKLMEVDVSIDELAEILGEELELPNIKPKGQENISDERHKYTGIRRQGPESLKHLRRTFKESLKRQIASGTYNYNNPIILPEKSDKRYRSRKTIVEPEANAVILYMMDVSGSMGDDQKEIIRIESFWIDAWLTKQYKGLETRFIIHDTTAKEVSREQFFSTKESGGTRISSALEMSKQIIENDYPVNDWNIYLFQFSDGDNWSSEDNELCRSLLKDHLLPVVNMFAYGQVDSPHGSGQFINELKKNFSDEERVVLSEISGREDIVKSIKEFLGKGL